MGVASLFIIEYAAVVQSVDSHFSVSVDNVIIAHYDTDVGNPSFFIVKKCQIARGCFLYKTQGFSLGSLLTGIPEQSVSV